VVERVSRSRFLSGSPGVVRGPGKPQRRSSYSGLVNPEDTDKYKRFEDVMYRLADLPKKVVQDLKKTDASEEEAPESPDETPKRPERPES